MKAPRSFSYDHAKHNRNAVERGISFEQAKAFEFDTAMTATDDRRDYGEVREVAFGFIGSRLHVLVFTMRGETCHVISLGKANTREVRTYVENLG